MRRAICLRLPILIATLAISGCVTAPPSQTADLCEIFYEKDGWFDAAEAAEDRWGAPIPVQMSIMHQESSFVGDARPPRRRLLWIIPWTRISSAYGYTQALDGTWDWYKDDTGSRFASRSDFDDATDFIGWYLDKSQRMAGIPKHDAYRQYLAYHEGQGGYRSGSYRAKPWLMRTARRVDSRSQRYAGQLAGCRQDLENSGPWWWPF